MVSGKPLRRKKSRARIGKALKSILGNRIAVGMGVIATPIIGASIIVYNARPDSNRYVREMDVGEMHIFYSEDANGVKLIARKGEDRYELYDNRDFNKISDGVNPETFTTDSNL